MSTDGTRGAEAAFTLDELFHRRWSVPLLAALGRGGGRLVVLAQRLGANQVALRQALDGLIELGLAQRNPGYGHPARPEYVLTARGGRLGPASAALVDALARRRLEDELLRKWPLPVLHAIGGEARRYGEIRQRLPGVTDRALAGALKELERHGLVRRRISREWPPVAHYEAAASSTRLRALLDELAAGFQR
jgi:DNA-binding HxlR family transcriptional regulator